MWRWIALGLFSLLLVACNGESTSSDENAPPPSETPIPATATEIPASSTPLPQPTLPATWTPQPSNTPRTTPGSFNPGNASPTATFTPSATAPPPEDVCFLFSPDDDRNEPSDNIFTGDSATIHWNTLPLEGYTYRFELYHPDGTLVVNQEVPTSPFTIDASQLTAVNFTYGWQVIPLLNGDEACFPISGEIYVNPIITN